MIRSFLLFSIILVTHLNANVCEERFTRIYNEKLWGVNSEGEGFSGGGSLLVNIRPYYDYLTEFLISQNIGSVVDIGCGDWEFSKYIQWGEYRL